MNFCKKDSNVIKNKPDGDKASVGGKTLGAVLGAGNPTGSIFQLIIEVRAGATGTGQQPDSPGTLEKSLPLPSALPFEISIVSLRSLILILTKYLIY